MQAHVFFSILITLSSIVLGGRLYIQEAGISGTPGPELTDGVQFCPSSFSSTGFSILCETSPNATHVRFFIGDEFESIQFVKPFSIAGTTSEQFVNPWSPPANATITCLAFLSSDQWIETFRARVSFTCENQVSPTITPSPSPTQIVQLPPRSDEPSIPPTPSSSPIVPASQLSGNTPVNGSGATQSSNTCAGIQFDPATQECCDKKVRSKNFCFELYFFLAQGATNFPNKLIS